MDPLVRGGGVRSKDETMTLLSTFTGGSQPSHPWSIHNDTVVLRSQTCHPGHIDSTRNV